MKNNKLEEIVIVKKLKAVESIMLMLNEEKDRLESELVDYQSCE